MTWELTEDEARQLLALPTGDRAIQFFQLITDWEESWGLLDAEGWVVASETDALPLWPHATLAAACAVGPWEGALPEPVSLDDLIDELLPLLAEDGLRIAVFPAPHDPGLLLDPGEVREQIEREMEIGR